VRLCPFNLIQNLKGTEREGGHRGEIITTETQRTRSSDPEWEMVLSFCILDFSVTPCSLCLCGNNFFSVSSFSLCALPPRFNFGNDSDNRA
jgi:hypothetical protein